MDGYKQLCASCVDVLAAAAAAVDLPTTSAPPWEQIDWGSDWIGGILAGLFLLSAAAAIWSYLQPEPDPEIQPWDELDRYAWYRAARRGGTLGEHSSFLASYRNARVALVKAHEVRFACPALFEPWSPSADPVLSPDPSLPTDPHFSSSFGSPRPFAFIITGQRVMLHYKRNGGSAPFTVSIALSEIMKDQRGGTRFGATLAIRTASGTVPLRLMCTPDEFNDVVALLMGPPV